MKDIYMQGEKNQQIVCPHDATEKLGSTYRKSSKLVILIYYDGNGGSTKPNEPPLDPPLQVRKEEYGNMGGGITHPLCIHP